MHKKSEEGRLYYLYRHIRLDEPNEVFYVGKGTSKLNKTTEKSRYFRAYQRNPKSRSRFWNNIVAKTDYEVEILFESHDVDFILNKEMEFIKLYGRRDLGLGTLVNLTDGGEKEGRWIYTEEMRQRRKNNPYVVKYGEDHHSAKKVFAYLANGEFYKEYSTVLECGQDLKVGSGAISRAAKTAEEISETLKARSAKGYRFFYKFQGGRIEPYKREGPKHGCKAVQLLDDQGNIIETFESVKGAARVMKEAPVVIDRSIRLGKPSRKGNFYRLV